MNDGRLQIIYSGEYDWKVKLDGRELTESMPITQIVLTLTPADTPQVIITTAPQELNVDLADVDVTYEGKL